MRLFKRRLKNALSSTTATLKIIKRKIVQNGSFQIFFSKIIFFQGQIFEIWEILFENFAFIWELVLKQTNSQDDKS